MVLQGKIKRDHRAARAFPTAQRSSKVRVEAKQRLSFDRGNECVTLTSSEQYLYVGNQALWFLAIGDKQSNFAVGIKDVTAHGMI